MSEVFYYNLTTGEFSGSVKPNSEWYGETTLPVPELDLRQSALFVEGKWVVLTSVKDPTPMIEELEAELVSLKGEINYNLAMGYDTSTLVVRAREVEIMLEELRNG